MGIESDKLVYDYLGKVGDLAQTTLPSAQRVKLVSRLRDDIDRARGKAVGDSPATVRRILGRLGTPSEVVEAAASASGAAAAQPPMQPPVPAPPRPSVPSAPSGSAAAPPVPERPGPATAPGAGPAPEWWRASPGNGARTNDILGAGWTGGLILPEFDGEPAAAEAVPAGAGEGAAEAGPAEAAGTAGPRGRFRLRLPSRLRRTVPEEAAAPPRRGLPTGPIEVVAALALVAGAVLTNFILLVAGWALAYTTRGLSRSQAKFAAIGVPGIVVCGTLVWLWGRVAGHWGALLPGGRLGAAFSADVPDVIRVAAFCSALYLVWAGVIRRR